MEVPSWSIRPLTHSCRGVLLLVGLIPGFVCGIAASVVAFLAQVGRGERAASVYLGYVPVACVLLTAALNSLFFN